eukprot:TRINITY_DN47_c0_g1_i2.p1 TRINITY_DN47_c0_g1~~TRINITY_DN47_c0_g1_i2.p1  ORF type:complete len:278 (+),score=84.41 TRINITY_DN47_c0_g1_i2:37-870(+)
MPTCVWVPPSGEGIDYETPLNENGEKTVVTYTTNEQGQRVKITKVVKVRTYQKKVNKRVEERRKRWVKFGRCANSQGREQGISYVGDEVAFVLGDAQRKEKEREEQEKKDKQQIDNMYQKLLTQTTGRPGIPTAISAPTDDGPAAWRPSWKKGSDVPPSAGPGSAPAAESSGRYVPPRGREGASPFGQDEESTLRVSNISDETAQDDLYEMFGQFGRLSRVHLVMDKRTGESRGFAFVNYMRKSDAEAVLAMVDSGKKLGLHNFIFNIEFARPAQGK